MTIPSSFQHAPHEILLNIFRLLSIKSLVQCQHVCRSWYLSAHLLLLTNINLTTPFHVHQFLQSLQINSNTNYLKSVASISVGDKNVKSVESSVTGEYLEELFCQFPYLKKITINGWLQSFNDERVSESICSQVETISVDVYWGCLYSKDNVENYKDFAYKIRTKLTNLVMPPSRFDNRSERDIMDYLCAFPHLQELEVPESFASKNTNMTTIMKLIDKLPNLKVLRCKVLLDMGDVMDIYLCEKTKEGQAALLDKLSKLESFSLQCIGPHLYPNVVQFITQYLTGLETLVYRITQTQHWTLVQKDAFRHLLEYACHLPSFDINVLNTAELTILDCLQVIPTSSSITDLQVSINYEDFPFSLNLKPNNIQIWCPYSVKLHRVCGKLFKSTTLRNDIRTLKVDTMLSFGELNHFPLVFFFTLEALLDNLPSVTKVILNTPMASDQDEFKVPKVYPQINYLEVNVSLNINERKTVDTIISMFPRVKYLTMHYFCGVYDIKKRCMLLSLDNNELERLELDLSFAYKEMTEPAAFLVLDVYLVDKGKHYFYKVSFDYFGITVLDELDIITGHMQVKIVVKDLKLLRVFLYTDIQASGKLYFDESPQDIKEAKIRLY